MGLFDDVFDVVHGGVGVVTGVVELAGDVITGDVHGAVTDAQKVVGDANDVVHGLDGLGMPMGGLPGRVAENPLVQLSDSPPLEAAQLVIEALKLTTGSGAPEDGARLGNSATLLDESAEILYDAKPHSDRWDGSASSTYEDVDVKHKNATSHVGTADDEIRKVLTTEAEQVKQTRNTLDDWSQYLYDFGLATSWMNLVPGGRAAKLAVDAAAAAVGVGAAERAIGRLVLDSMDNAGKIRAQLHLYDHPGEVELPPGSACAPFASKDHKAEEVLPSRVLPSTPYEVPDPIKPPEWGPPATPYTLNPAAPPSSPAIGRPAAVSGFVAPTRVAPALGSTHARQPLPTAAALPTASSVVSSTTRAVPGTAGRLPRNAVDVESNQTAATIARA